MRQLTRMCSRLLSIQWNARSIRPMGAAVLAVMLLVTNSAVGGDLSIFRRFPDDAGKIQSIPSNITISTADGIVVQVDAPLDSTNKFFDPTLGTNGQACVTCHQPDQGFTIHVETIQDAFEASGGTDPLFRPNDTANNPHVSTLSADAYSLTLTLGVTRIGKTFASNANFTAVAANQETIDNFAAPEVFPLLADPQQPPGQPTLSLFRRPVVNTNVRLDSAVLWDGRASIANMRGQVTAAAATLLLDPNLPQNIADEIAAFMLGVFTDQVFDTAAGTDANEECTLTAPGQECGAGSVSGKGAQAGVRNLLQLALSPDVPCTNFLADNPDAGGVGCIESTPGYDLFDAWAQLPNTGSDAARLTVARGQAIFNNANLQVPPDLTGQLGQEPIHCTTCHATRNIGSNPDATLGFFRTGNDSLRIINALLKNPGNASPATQEDLKVLMERVRLLPLYLLTATGPNNCAITEVETTDPGRAMVSGDICDVGKFKPPILRGLAARSPYFHAGVAESIQMLIHFYNARFQIGLTENEVTELTAFLEAQ